MGVWILVQENVCARHKSWQSSQLINQTVKDSWWIYHFQKSLLNPALWKIQQLLQKTDKYLLQSMLQIDFVWLYSFVLPFQFFKVNSESDKFSPLCCSKLQCFDWHGYIPSGGSWMRGIISLGFWRHIVCRRKTSLCLSFFSTARLYHNTGRKFLQELRGLVGRARTTLGMPRVGHRRRASCQATLSLQAVCAPSLLWQHDERNTFTLITSPPFSKDPHVPLSFSS